MLLLEFFSSKAKFCTHCHYCQVKICLICISSVRSTRCISLVKYVLGVCLRAVDRCWEIQIITHVNKWKNIFARVALDAVAWGPNTLKHILFTSAGFRARLLRVLKFGKDNATGCRNRRSKTIGTMNYRW